MHRVHIGHQAFFEQASSAAHAVLALAHVCTRAHTRVQSGSTSRSLTGLQLQPAAPAAACSRPSLLRAANASDITDSDEMPHQQQSSIVVDTISVIAVAGSVVHPDRPASCRDRAIAQIACSCLRHIAETCCSVVTSLHTSDPTTSFRFNTFLSV